MTSCKEPGCTVAAGWWSFCQADRMALAPKEKEKEKES